MNPGSDEGSKFVAAATELRGVCKGLRANRAGPDSPRVKAVRVPKPPVVSVCKQA